MKNMNIYLYIIIGVLLLAIGILILYHFFGKDYEFTEEEQKELQELDLMRSLNKTDLLMKNISKEEFIKKNNEFIEMLNDIEKKNRKRKRK